MRFQIQNFNFNLCKKSKEMDEFINDFKDFGLTESDFDLEENEEQRPTCQACLR